MPVFSFIVTSRFSSSIYVKTVVIYLYTDFLLINHRISPKKTNKQTNKTKPYLYKKSYVRYVYIYIYMAINNAQQPSYLIHQKKKNQPSYHNPMGLCKGECGSKIHVCF